MRVNVIALVLVAAVSAGCVSQSENRAIQFPASAPTPDSATAAAMDGPICVAVEGEAMPDGSNAYCYFREDLDSGGQHSTPASRAAFIGEKYKYLCVNIDVRSDAIVRSRGTPVINLISVGFTCHR